MTPGVISAPHFHIHWSTSNTLDWQRFATRQEAQGRAEDLVRPHETFSIEEQSSDCPFCTYYKMSATA